MARITQKDMIVGAKFKIKKTTMLDAQEFLFGTDVSIPIGSVITITKKPKKYDGINLVEVASDVGVGKLWVINVCNNTEKV